LRKWSLDEIPQFWNVLLGTMSLVGPRPELVIVVETKYETWQHRRHVVKPGITGLWQVTARNDGPLMYECTAVDIEYVDNVTFLGDMRLLLQTLPSALGHHPRK
jgi:lipopolysaccharide/colanic/teichoic acid biosynthesis glycosyltransferase